MAALGWPSNIAGSTGGALTTPEHVTHLKLRTIHFEDILVVGK